MIIPVQMLMCGKEANNQKQEIDCQHHTFDTYTHLQVDDVKEEMYVMMQKENELMHQEEIVEQLASEEEMEMFNF